MSTLTMGMPCTLWLRRQTLEKEPLPLKSSKAQRL
jgi:hypothetical protein